MEVLLKYTLPEDKQLLEQFNHVEEYRDSLENLLLFLKCTDARASTTDDEHALIVELLRILPESIKNGQR